MTAAPFTAADRVLILGATGFVGKTLVPALARKQVKLRILARDKAKVAAFFPAFRDIEVVEGDVPSSSCCEIMCSPRGPRTMCQRVQETACSVQERRRAFAQPGGCPCRM
jgi:short subunit dehydrogenase-like uncharacterized protein